MLSALKQQVKRAIGRGPSGPPPVQGVADAAWYDAAYKAIPGYNAPYWESHYYFLWSVLADRVRQAKARSVLDIGCGPGQLASCLFALGGIESYIGLDYSAHAITMAKQACPQGQFVVDDATTTDIHQRPHDLVICTEVLEHVPDDDRVVDRFRSGVRCLCTVPNFPYDSHVRHFNNAAVLGSGSI